MSITDSAQDAVTRAAIRQARTSSARQSASRAGFGALGALIVLAIWYAVAISEVFGPGLIPSPDEVAGTTLVGREAELARLRMVVARLHGDGGRVVLVEGEAGIGKSRLVREVRESTPAVTWLREQGVTVEPIEKNVIE